MKYPKRFKMTDKVAGNSCKVVYDATKNVYIQDYLDGGIKMARTEKEITTLLKHYDIVKSPKERDLVFPFTFVVSKSASPILYTATHDGSSRVQVGWEGDDSEEGVTYPMENVKTFVTNGTWIVKSVGSSEPTAPPAPSKEAAKPLDSLVIKVSSEGVVEATEQVKCLAQAIEEVNIALESFQAIFEDTRELLLGSNPSGCVTFCCEDA